MVKSLLIVDDDQQNLKLYKIILKKLNLNVSCVTNGNDAYKEIIENKPDLVLMDINIPGINGMDVMHKIRELGSEFKQVKIIAQTAGLIDSKVNPYIKAGFDDYLPKPFNIKEFIQKIEENLD